MPNEEVKIYECFKHCNCDMDGKPVWGFDDRRITYNEEIAKEKGARWGSTTCSKCGQIAIIKEGH